MPACGVQQGMSADTQNRRRLVYGRRQGHKLRKGQQRLMDDLLPEIRVDIDALGHTAPGDLFDPPRKRLWMEIGFGSGEHLIWQATTNPGVGLIGCEPFVNGVASLLRHIENESASNVLVHDDDARDLLEALPDACLEKVFLLYPDPWPKLRHNKRRFVSPENLDRLAAVLVDGGELRFASDIPDYVRWTLEHVHRQGSFEWTARSPRDWRRRPDDWPQTRYERKALDAGRVPAYLTFKRRARRPARG